MPVYEKPKEPKGKQRFGPVNRSIYPRETKQNIARADGKGGQPYPKVTRHGFPIGPQEAPKFVKSQKSNTHREGY